jgi:hypothetical protein
MYNPEFKWETSIELRLFLEVADKTFRPATSINWISYFPLFAKFMFKKLEVGFGEIETDILCSLIEAVASNSTTGNMAI